MRPSSILSAIGLDGQERRNVGGYAMAALLVAIGVMAVMLTAAMPAWRQLVQREKEEELIFRGQQYVRAIGLFQRKFGVTYPPNIDVLIEQHCLRKKYKDPMTEDGEFQLLYQGMLAAQRPGQGGQAGPLASRGQGPGTGSSLGGSLSGSSPTPFAQQAGRGGVGTQLGVGSGAGQGARGGGPLGGRGGIMGVVSKSTAKSIRLYNGRNFYNEWEFIYLAASARPGVGIQVPGQMGPPGPMRAPGQQQGPFGGPGRGQRGFGPGGQQGSPRGPIGPGGTPTRPRNPGGGPGN